jgi:hypothetical protein
MEQARAAEQRPKDLPIMQAAAREVLRALDPVLVKDGKDTYGVRPGITAIIEQLTALRSGDAHADVARLGSDALVAARNVAGWCDQAIAVAQRIGAATTADDAARFAHALSTLTRQLLVGSITDGIGPRALSTASTGGLFFVQMRVTMLKAGRDAVAAHPGTAAAVAARPPTTDPPLVSKTAAPPTVATTPPVALPLLPAGKPGTLPVTRVDGGAR